MGKFDDPGNPYFGKQIDRGRKLSEVEQIETRIGRLYIELRECKGKGGRPQGVREIDGEKLLEARGDRSQAQFARWCGVSVASLQRVEGGRAVSRKVSNKIAKYCKRKGFNVKKNPHQKPQ